MVCRIVYVLIMCAELEDAPSQQLGYSLTRMLFQISERVPKFETKAQQVFVDHLEKIGKAFSRSVSGQGNSSSST
jgi:hypothetical protein